MPNTGGLADFAKHVLTVLQWVKFQMTLLTVREP